MPLITTADERLSRSDNIKMLIVGPPKIGKTSLLWTLPPDETLAIDMEAGLLAVEGWTGDSLDVRAQANELGIHPWIFLKHLACLVAGPNPAVLNDNDMFSRAHFTHVVQMLGEREAVVGKYKHLFWDSITQTGRYSFSWAKTQPAAFSEKTGKPDTRGAYGLHGQEMVGASGLLSHLQHTPDKNIIMVGILEEVVDDYKRKSWRIQIDGGKAGNELPGIVDEIISMVDVEFEGGQTARAFVCHQQNPWGYPAGDRSGRLELVERPHLGDLIEKLRGPAAEREMSYTVPSSQPATEPTPEFQAAAPAATASQSGSEEQPEGQQVQPGSDAAQPSWMPPTPPAPPKAGTDTLAAAAALEAERDPATGEVPFG